MPLLMHRYKAAQDPMTWGFGAFILGTSLLLWLVVRGPQGHIKGCNTCTPPNW